jgi:hypothetical protein
MPNFACTFWEAVLNYPKIFSNNELRKEIILVSFHTKTKVDFIFDTKDQITFANESVVSAFLKSQFSFDIWWALNQLFLSGYRVFDSWGKWGPFRDYIPLPTAGLENLDSTFLKECFQRVKQGYLPPATDVDEKELWFKIWYTCGLPNLDKNIEVVKKI